MFTLICNNTKRPNFLEIKLLKTIINTKVFFCHNLRYKIFIKKKHYLILPCKALICLLDFHLKIAKQKVD